MQLQTEELGLYTKAEAATILALPGLGRTWFCIAGIGLRRESMLCSVAARSCHNLGM
jgi:hypothetical protein